MNRRGFLSLAGTLGAGWPLLPAGGTPAGAALQQHAGLAGGNARNLLILLELKGGNDGLNTLVPYADPAYYRLRPTIGIGRDTVLQLDQRLGLHPSLQALWPLWQDGQLAVVQGLGYPTPNLSHFRSMEIWDTASRSDEYLQRGWLARALAAGLPSGQAATGVLLGSVEHGPLHGAPALTLIDPAGWAHQTMGRDASQARLGPPTERLKTNFGQGTFAASVKTAMHMLAAVDTEPARHPVAQGVAVLRLTLHGFDTHHNQPARQADLLRQLAESMVALRCALIELGRWHSTLIMTYAEFGRRPRENQTGGTEHGTAAPHFVAGGRVRGGLFGTAPDLAHLDANGSLFAGIDFRQLYATVLHDWWGVDAERVLQGRFERLPILKT